MKATIARDSPLREACGVWGPLEDPQLVQSFHLPTCVGEAVTDFMTVVWRECQYYHCRCHTCPITTREQHERPDTKALSRSDKVSVFVRNLAHQRFTQVQVQVRHAVRTSSYSDRWPPRQTTFGPSPGSEIIFRPSS